VGFGREKWVKQALCRVRGQASAIVDDVQLHAMAYHVLGTLMSHNSDGMGSGLQAVRQQNLQHLCQLDQMALDESVVACEINGHLYTAFVEVLSHALKDHVDERRELERSQRQVKWLDRTEEGPQPRLQEVDLGDDVR
jgi:hypothetical protein